METLKFLMISTHFPPFNLGGDAVLVDYLSRELIGRGHDVHVLHSPVVYQLVKGSRDSRAATKVEGKPTTHEFKPRLGRLEAMLTLSLEYSGRARRVVENLMESIRPDVLHWHNTKGLIGRPFDVRGIVSLYTAHDYYLVCPRSNLARPDMRYCTDPSGCLSCTARWMKPPQFWRVGSKRVVVPPDAVKVLAPTEFMANRLRQDGIKVHAVVNNFVPDPGPLSLIDPQQRTLISYVGMLEPHKGPQTLLEAFARSKDSQGFELHIMGDGSMKARMRQRARALGVADRVRIPGFVPREELETALRKSAALVIPSEWPEVASLIAMEAFSLGVPVIASEQGGLPETVGTDSGSILFKAGDVGGLASAIVSVWNSRMNLNEPSRKARTSYEARFSPEIHVSKYLGIVRQLASDLQK